MAIAIILFLVIVVGQRQQIRKEGVNIDYLLEGDDWAELAYSDRTYPVHTVIDSSSDLTFIVAVE